MMSGRATPPFGKADYSRPVTPDHTRLEEGFADTEDAEYFGFGDKPKRKSWLALGNTNPKSGKGTPGHGTSGSRGSLDIDEQNESVPMSPMTRVPGDYSSSPSAGPSRSASQELTGVLNAARSIPGNPRFANAGQHTYPPIQPAGRASPDRNARSSMAPSVDGRDPSTSMDAGDVLDKAAKALKTAVLHDARNIKGKDTTDADVTFTITSPHEAKVSFLQALSLRPI